MLLNADASQLEWVCAVYLSKDKVGYDEILNAKDLHTDNQKKFNLPERRIAKIFLFRLIYGGTVFHKDPLFMEVSARKKFWDDIIEQFYNKYKGLHKWHTSLLNTVVSTGKWVNPTGRIYTFERQKNPWTQSLEWPRTQILNYPVQGLAADTMAIVRVLLHQRIVSAGMLSEVKQIATVHDSILLDIPAELCYTIILLVQKAFDDTPAAFEALFGVPFDLPYRCEITVGPNKKDMTKWVVNANLPQLT